MPSIVAGTAMPTPATDCTALGRIEGKRPAKLRKPIARLTQVWYS